MLGVVADHPIEVESEQGEHRLGDGQHLLLDVVLVVIAQQRLRYTGSGKACCYRGRRVHP